MTNFEIPDEIHTTAEHAPRMLVERPVLSQAGAGAQKKIRSLCGKAIMDFSMIEGGDLVMACMAGGADSYTMLDTLLYLKTVAPIRFDVIAVNLDQKQP